MGGLPAEGELCVAVEGRACATEELRVVRAPEYLDQLVESSRVVYEQPVTVSLPM